ncbi:hypothetical protein SOVF_079030 [Spinacia oleracea]|nr:hypothetical protein SOVF_079030 [Spinacia oleracea]
MNSGGETVVKHATYRNSAKAPGNPGILKMTMEEFAFSPYNPTSGARVRVRFNSIGGVLKC